MRSSRNGRLCVIDVRVILSFAFGVTFLGSPQALGEARTGNEGGRTVVNRVIHTFDFDEPNTYDTIPRYWVRFPDAKTADASFPRYTEAKFDRETGHRSQPSFYLESKGRSVGYRYVGPDTRIRPGTYRVRGWIKADQLRHGRAAISAYYLDWDGQFIADTQQYTRLIGGDADNSDWQQVEIEMSDVPAGAQFIGVTCWLVQQDVWRDGVRPHRHIDHMDVLGGAWFDDIQILEEPFIDLSFNQPGNVVPHGDTPRILATVADDVTDGLSAELTVTDGSGRVLVEQSIPVLAFERRQETSIAVSDLAPGLYDATLTVRSGGELVVARRLRFAQLGAAHRPPGEVSTRMGVTISKMHPEQVADELALFDALGCGIVKIPLWTGDVESPGIGSDPQFLRETMDLLLASRVEVVGVLGGSPVGLVQALDEHTLTLLDILSDNPKAWRSHLDVIVAPYASVFRSWQLGFDGDRTILDDPRYRDAFGVLRSVMGEMIAAPDLTAIQSGTLYPEPKRFNAENLSVDLPADIKADFISEHMREFIEDGRSRNGYGRVWASVAPAETNEYEQADALIEWTMRILEARWGGADVVFATQPWRTRKVASGFVTEPTAAFLAYHTLTDVVADALPQERLRLNGTAQAMTFSRGDRSVWVIWDPQAPPQGRTLSIQLGTADEAVDLLGRQVPLTRTSDGRHALTVFRSPVFVIGAERWLPAFRAGVQLSPSRADFAFDAREHSIRVVNPHDVALSGTVELDAPSGWVVDPPRFQFTLYPGEERSFVVSMRHPSSESAGRKLLHAHVRLASAGRYYQIIPLELDLNLHDVDVWGYAVMEGGRLVVRHGMTSRADVPLSFRSFATYPGKSRQYRVIYELLPGQTLATEYTFNDVSPSAGKSIRLGLREVNGPRLHNLQIDAP